jgi:hypothetical protein
MRRLITVLVSAGLLFSAGAAGALSIDPNPVNQQRDGGTTLDADVSLISLSGDTMTFQLAVTTGSISRIDVSMLFDEITLPTAFSYVSAVGTNTGTGTESFASAVNAVTEGQFTLSATVDAGETSDQFWVRFDAPIQALWDGTITFDTGTAVSENYSVTPEPTTLVLIGSGLVGLAASGRRRRRA